MMLRSSTGRARHFPLLFQGVQLVWVYALPSNILSTHLAAQGRTAASPLGYFVFATHFLWAGGARWVAAIMPRQLQSARKTTSLPPKEPSAKPAPKAEKPAAKRSADKPAAGGSGKKANGAAGSPAGSPTTKQAAAAAAPGGGGSEIDDLFGALKGKKVAAAAKEEVAPAATAKGGKGEVRG